MLNLINEIGISVLSNLVQLIAGCLLSVPVYIVGQKLKNTKDTGYAASIAIIALSSICGILLPLDVYGVLPIIIAVLSLTDKLYIALPMLISNVMFNNLVPYTDISFVWRTGYRRAVLALTAGILAGILIKMFIKKGNSIVRNSVIKSLAYKPTGISGMLSYIGRFINAAGLYIIVGVVLNASFKKYVVVDVFDFIYSNSNTSFIPRFFARHNVTSPSFLLVMTTIYMLMDLFKLSALAALLRFKGITLYYVYYIFIAFILAIPTFI